MRITRLAVKDMRRYRDLEINLGGGLTVVRGPNEAGKTTLQRMIELALTRRVTSASAEMDALRPWDAADDARPILTMDFEVDDEENGLRKGTVEKSFRGAKGTVRLEYDGQTITDPTLADQVLAEITGIPSEAFFRSTASIRHHELADLERDEATLRDRLQASISGADRGTSRAKRTLERALYELNTRGMKNPGRLKVAEDAVEQAQGSYDVGELALNQLERDRDSLSAARERRSGVESSLVERRGLLEKARQAERLSTEREAARERFERYRQAVAILDELARLQDGHPSANPLPVLEQIVGRLRSLETRIRELTAALSGEIAVQFDIPPEPSWRPLSRIAVALVVIGLVVAGGAFLINALDVAQLGPLPPLLGIAVAAIGVIIAVVAVWLRRGDQVQKELRDVEIDRRLRGKTDMQMELNQAEADRSMQLEAIGESQLAGAEDLLARETEHVGRINRLEAELVGLVGREPSEELPRLRDAAALEMEQKAHALEALGPIAREPRARERLEVEVRDLEASLERARDDEADSRARLEANKVDAEQVAAHAERLEAWKDQLGVLQRRTRVYDRTLREIERAEQATMKTATRFLEKRMVGDLDRATAGRYRHVAVDDKTLDIRIHAPEKGDWVDVSSMSQGTIDLVYLTARLGLVRLVTGDRRPPLVFDDPFVTLDDRRAAKAFELLRDVARDFQVIYLTTSDRYDPAADEVIELPGPTALDELTDEEAEGAVDAAG